MSNGDWWTPILTSPWRDWVIAAALLAVGLPLLIWALVGDRSRGRRRCPKCWYDLRGTLGRKCSECGFEATTERALFRSRRRWRSAIFALAALLASAAVILVPRVDWPGLVPTWMLLRLAPTVDNEIVFEPNGDSHQHWISKQLAIRQVAATLTGAEWEQQLSRPGIIRARPVWPAGEPFVFRANVPRWAQPAEFRISIANAPRSNFVVNGWTPFEIQHPWDWIERHAYCESDPLPTGSDAVDLQIETRFGSWGTDTVYFSPDKTARSTVHLPVRVVASLDEVLTATHGARIDALIQSALKVRAWSGRTNIDGRPRIELAFDRTAAPDDLKDIAFGFAIDVCRDGDVCETLYYPPPTRRPPWGPPIPTLAWGCDKLKPADLQTPAQRAHLSLRIRGDAHMALRDWNRAHYWSGEFTLPLESVLVPDAAR